jgi:hypothetical protein
MPPVDEALRTDTTKLPPPVRAGIGLVAAGVSQAKEQAKHLPGRFGGLAMLPMRGLELVATARETVERTYEELSNRGETIVARWRGQAEPRQTATAPPPAAKERVPDVEEIVDPFGLPAQVAEAVVDATPGATLSHDELPLEDYDHLTLGSLRARLPRLDPVALVQLRDYERAHAHRLPVLTMLENRIAKVSNTP